MIKLWNRFFRLTNLSSNILMIRLLWWKLQYFTWYISSSSSSISLSLCIACDWEKCKVWGSIVMIELLLSLTRLLDGLVGAFGLLGSLIGSPLIVQSSISISCFITIFGLLVTPNAGKQSSKISATNYER